LRNDNSIQININYLHHNPEEWREPEKFIPERFNTQSEYYYKPDGNKRHPSSFCPFLGGKRVCLGQDFALLAAKYMIAIIVTQLEF
jgi:cytochrome P450